MAQGNMKGQQGKSGRTPKVPPIPKQNQTKVAKPTGSIDKIKGK